MIRYLQFWKDNFGPHFTCSLKTTIINKVIGRIKVKFQNKQILKTKLYILGMFSLALAMQRSTDSRVNPISPVALRIVRWTIHDYQNYT